MHGLNALAYCTTRIPRSRDVGPFANYAFPQPKNRGPPEGPPLENA